MTEAKPPRAAAEKHDFDMDARLAFSQALASIEPVFKHETADTGKYTYSYASLGDILDECKRVCELHGLVLTQIPTVVEGHFALILTLFHTSGGQVAFQPLMTVLPKEAQAYGSMLTYCRRYQLVTVFGIATEDDDGRAATVAAQVQPGRRTEAERMIRESIAVMDDVTRKSFTEDFRRQFGMGLSDLPANRHGDALTWSREWSREQLDPDVQLDGLTGQPIAPGTDPDVPHDPLPMGLADPQEDRPE